MAAKARPLGQMIQMQGSALADVPFESEPVPALHALLPLAKELHIHLACELIWQAETLHGKGMWWIGVGFQEQCGQL
jgi:hypothetical protein